MVISGYVENNKIILDEDIELPDGTKVEIILPEIPAATSSGLCGIWQDERPVEEIIAEIIESRTSSRDVEL